jgi:hypothetical protein
MKRALVLTATAVMLGAVAVAAASAAPTTIVIRHQVRGCHTWSVNGGPWAASQSIRLVRNGVITIVDNDVMPHKLIQKSGPAVRYIGNRAMSHMGASVKVAFAKPGVYRFTTKAGEDYMNMPMMKTIGEDNVLRLTVTVP